MTGLPLSAGRMGMLMSPMSSISPANSVNNPNKPGLLKYLKNTYHNLPVEQKNLLRNLAHGNVATPLKLYTYNSLAEYPYTYDPKIVLPSFLPHGNTPAEILRDTIRKASSIPDFYSINEFNLGKVAEHNKSHDIQLRALATGAITPDKFAQPNPLDPITQYTIDLVKKDPSFRANARDLYTMTTAQRRELLARSLGVYNESKGSLYGEVPIENIDPFAQKYFKRIGVKNKVLSPYLEALNAPTSYILPNKLKELGENINRNPNKPKIFHSGGASRGSIPLDYNEVSGNFTARYDPNKKTIAAFDNFDFAPNSIDNSAKGFGGWAIKLMRSISPHITQPVPIYQEYDVSKLIKNKDNK